MHCKAQFCSTMQRVTWCLTSDESTTDIHSSMCSQNLAPLHESMISDQTGSGSHGVRAQCWVPDNNELDPEGYSATLSNAQTLRVLFLHSHICLHKVSERMKTTVSLKGPCITPGTGQALMNSSHSKLHPYSGVWNGVGHRKWVLPSKEKKLFQTFPGIWKGVRVEN